MTIERIGPEADLLHEAVIHKDTIYLAGCVAEDTGGDMYAQTKELLAYAEDLLTRLGSGKDRLLSATIFLADFAAKPEMNRAWKEWLTPGSTPARATIGVDDLGPGVLIEVTFIAAR